MKKITLETIDKAEAFRYMGHSGGADENLSALLDSCEKKMLGALSPSFVYRVFDTERTDEGVLLVGTPLTLKGKDIKNHLDGCDRAVILCMTLGTGADALIRKSEIGGITEAFALDALASAAAEQVCDRAELIIREALTGSFLTWRFSPGYGDFPIETQKPLLSVMNAGRLIGLCAEENNILIPRKSVTAVLGVSEKPLPPKQRGCAFCNLAETCAFRKRGDHCGS